MEQKNMQDETPYAIVCPNCRRIIVPASRIYAYRERDIAKIIKTHHCSKAMESKADFESEVR